MIISFFEEFLTKENLNKAKLIDFPTKLYLAAPSLKAFNRAKSSIKNKYIKEFIYWPILERNEGYWISPFSKRTALKRIFKEINNSRVPVMLDLELPTTQKPSLYVTQALNFLANKALIKRFIKDYNGQIYLAEYFPMGRRKLSIFKALGIHYSAKKAIIIKMFYSSLHSFSINFLKTEFHTAKKRKYLIGLGTISTGIHGTDTILSKETLKRDLNLAKKAGIKETIIFRLGGLNKNYKKIIKNNQKRAKVSSQKK
jgi:hypothetical protein